MLKSTLEATPDEIGGRAGVAATCLLSGMDATVEGEGENRERSVVVGG